MNIDSDNDQPMRTPPSNSPPSSQDERSPPMTPQMRSRPLMTEVTPGIMQLSEIIADHETESSEVTGKKKREEREIMLATKAENEKLLDKDWREAWLRRWEDDFDERDMNLSSFSTSTTPTTTTESSAKGKEPETAA